MTMTRDYQEYLKNNLGLFSNLVDLLVVRQDYTNKVLERILQVLQGEPRPETVGVAVPGYYVRTFDLSTEKTTSDPEEVSIHGDVLTFYTNGIYEGIQLVIGSKTNDWISLREFGNPYRCPVTFHKFYLAWTAQPNKYLRVHIGSSIGGAIGSGAGISITTTAVQVTDIMTFNQVAVGVTAVQLSSTSFPLKFGVVVKADDNNTDNIFVGDSTVNISTGFRLDAGQGVTLETSDISNVYIIADAVGQQVHYIGV